MHKIKIVGTSDKLKEIVNDDRCNIILRTEISNAAELLKSRGVDYITLDSIYEEAEDFDKLDFLLADKVIEEAQNIDVIYVVPGSAVSGDGSVAEIICKYDDVEIIAGDAPEYEMLAVLCGVDTSSGYATIPAACLQKGIYSSRLPLIITALDNEYLLSDTKLLLAQEYGDEHYVFIGEGKSYNKVHIYELDRYDSTSHKTMLYIPPKTKASRYDYHELEDVFRKLRAPDGCPWDREQTHETLKRYLLEECAEVLDAIDSGDMNELMDELGDVLLQVIFHAMIAEERGDFDMRDITDNLAKKLIRRHPHVFSDSDARTSEEVLTQWDKIKHDEKEDKSHTAKLKSVPKSMTALMRAQKVLSRAAKVEFFSNNDNDIKLVCEKIKSDAIRLQEMGSSDDIEKANDLIGDILFDVVNLSRLLTVEGELSLKARTKEYIEEFYKYELSKKHISF